MCIRQIIQTWLCNQPLTLKGHCSKKLQLEVAMQFNSTDYISRFKHVKRPYCKRWRLDQRYPSSVAPNWGFAPWVKVVLQGSPRSPDIHDLSEWHRLYYSPSYQFNSLNIDFKKISVRSVEDHLKVMILWPWVLVGPSVQTWCAASLQL